MDDYSVRAEEAAALLGMSAKTLRQRLRDERPEGARQIPPQHGGNWFLKASYVEQLAIQRGRRIPNRSALARDRLTSPRLLAVEKPSPQSAFADAVPNPSHGTWSEWIPFSEALKVAPRFPGVYMFRIAAEPHRGPVYIGMAGERKGNGLRGRLAIYASGKGAGSGLGEHAFDRALEDPKWLQARLDDALAGNPMRAKAAARSAIDHAGLEVRWQTVETRAEALQLEARLINEYRHQLWNR
ncbi:hypothetical protein [Arthrobacter sp. B6]|uniref:hypothetical protein n=1 Tax=Arthrobacter sp. B6 TaxID=1570137 RepID=UPI000A825F00|nr:hypothetical protein [Arthrobacter sp. B6]